MTGYLLFHPSGHMFEASEQWRVKKDLGVCKEQKEIMDEWQKINNKLGKKKIYIYWQYRGEEDFFLIRNTNMKTMGFVTALT